MEGQDLGDVEGMGEDIMKQMMSEFEKLGEKEDYSEVAYTLLLHTAYCFLDLLMACCLLLGIYSCEHHTALYSLRCRMVLYSGMSTTILP
jgi:hypothetical protein